MIFLRAIEPGVGISILLFKQVKLDHSGEIPWEIIET